MSWRCPILIQRADGTIEAGTGLIDGHRLLDVRDGRHQPLAPHAPGEMLHIPIWRGDGLPHPQAKARLS